MRLLARLHSDLLDVTVLGDTPLECCLVCERSERRFFWSVLCTMLVRVSLGEMMLAFVYGGDRLHVFRQWCRNFAEVLDMFTKNELVNIGKALVLQEKSVQRLAAKEGQPDSVAVEYRKVAVDIGDLLKKVTLEIVKLEQVKK